MSRRPPDRRARQRRRQRAQEQRKSAVWLWWGTGAVAVAVVAVILVLYASGVFGTGGSVADELTADQVDEVLAQSHIEGSEQAPVTLIEFADFQCPFCRDLWAGPLQTVDQTYVDNGVVRVAFHHMAFIGEESLRAAEASECAADQGKFFEYHDILYDEQGPENQGYLTTEKLLSFGDQVGLDMTAFEPCVTNRTHRNEIVEQTADASSIGVNSTPTVLVNGKRVTNPLQGNNLVNAIEAARTEANAG